MKNLCLVIGIALICVQSSSSQYSYVYEIRHDNKPQEKSELFGDYSQYKHNSPSELSKVESTSEPQTKNRDFAVRSPVMGPTILNLLKDQNNEKGMDQSSPVWQSPEHKSSLIYQSNNEAPIYSNHNDRPYSELNKLPPYSDKQHSIVSKSYPIFKDSQSYPIREDPHYYPRTSPLPRDLNQKDNRQTVHQLQTPNYRIKIVSDPEPLDKLMPYFQSKPMSQPLHQSYPQSDRDQSYYPQSSPLDRPHGNEAKPYILSIDPKSKRPEPLSHTISQVPEHPQQRQQSLSHSQPQQQLIHRPIHEIREEPHSQRFERYEEQPVFHQMPRHFPQEISQPLPHPILELPKQQLPPQLQQMSRSIHQSSQQPQQYSGQLHYSPSLIPQAKQHLMPAPRAQALYQMSAPDLTHRRPMGDMPPYSRVEYSSQAYDKEDNQRSSPYMSEPNPKIIYKYEEIPEKADALTVMKLREQLGNLHQNPSEQNRLFRDIVSKSVELSPKSQIVYSDIEDKQRIPTDPKYKSPPIPEEYKPFTQTRYYKTYV